MALVDFGTVQVYEMEDMVEVVFPYDREFVAFMKKMKGRWAPQRKAWQIKPAFVRTSSSEIVQKISEQLEAQAPKHWSHNLEVLRKRGCIMRKFEVFGGLAGLRVKMPLGHPCHHYLKEVDRLSNVRDTWYIPAVKFGDTAVQQAVARIFQDDFHAYEAAFEAAEERCLVGKIRMGAEEEEAHGMKKEGFVTAVPGFLKTADPVMADVPAREIAFEVLSMRRIDDETLKVKFEYVAPEEGHAHLTVRPFASNTLQAIGPHHMIDDDWVQKRS
ncbi:hypothetical protein [Salipiger mucosus]|nr:hypothetical protein [Salipiger mucosus]